MTATNEIDAFLCREDLADEFSDSPPVRHQVTLRHRYRCFSGHVPNKDEAGVMCTLMLRGILSCPRSTISSGRGAKSGKLTGTVDRSWLGVELTRNRRRRPLRYCFIRPSLP